MNRKIALMSCIKKGIRVFLVNIFVFLILYELLSIILIWGFSFETPPPYHTNRLPRIVDNHPVFGTWHLPNHDFFMSFSCFAVMNYYNEHGARDKSRRKKCPDCSDRIIVLGDSFIEGVGVDTANRFSDILEKNSVRECLNFGISAIGTTQTRLIYESLASQFEHNTIIFGHLPANDFDDDDYEQRFSVSNKNRYRPYVKKDTSGFELVYHLDSLEQSAWYPANIPTPDLADQLRQWLKNYTHMGRITAILNRRIKALIGTADNQPGFKNRFNNFSEDEWAILSYNLQQTRMFAPQKRIIVMTIPSLEDVRAYQKTKRNLLGEQLSEFCKKNNMEHIDLLPIFAGQEEVDRLYHSCDGHWSEQGNQLAASAVLEIL